MPASHDGGQSREETLEAILAQVAAAPDQIAPILDAQPEPLVAFTADRTILHANPEGAGFFGYGPGELDGRPTDQVVPERFRQPGARPQLPTRDITTVEIPSLRRDGSEARTAWTFASVAGPRGPIFVMLVRDQAQAQAQMARRERELEHRLRAVYENALDGIMLIGDDLHVVDANPAACRLLGRPRDAVVGMRAAELTPPSDPQVDSDRMGQFRSTGTLTGEGPILLPDGSTRRAEFGAVANVSPGLHLSIFRDIEDRKRAEEAQRFLDEASALLGASLDYDQTLRSVAVLAVPRMADWVGIDMLEANGAFRRVAVMHTDPAKVELAEKLRRQQQPTIHDATGLGAVVRTGKAELIETVTDEVLVAALATRPGLLKLIRQLGLVSAMTVPLSARGQVIGAISFVSAESRRRYTPADLSFAQELARRAGHAVENALLVRDLRRANRRSEHLQAIAARLVRAESVEEIAAAFQADDTPSPVPAYGWALFLRSGDQLHPVAATSSVRDALNAWESMPLAGGTPVAEAARTGEAIWLRDGDEMLTRFPGVDARAVRSDLGARVVLPLGAGPEPIGVLGVTFDHARDFDADDRGYLTAVANLWGQALHRARLAEAERDAIRRALEAETLATRKKDEFLAMLGHELRNPLAPIVTATSLLRVRGRASSRELEILDRQARHLVRLVDDLLDISRITSGKLALERSRVEVADIIAQAIESTSPMFEEKHLRLFSEVSSAALVLDGDRERLVQVIANILVNAAKFSPIGRSVFVTGGHDRDDAVITVRDEGQGIEPELLPRVFELFAQGPQSPDRRKGGLGLGLAIAQSIVAAHDGTIGIASPGVSQGTTVTIRLPLAAAVPAQVSDSQQGGVTASRATARHRVLIVDDNEDSAEMLAAFLSEVGYDCYVAPDGRRALSISREVLPDAAILDIGLPDIDGHQLAREMLSALAGRAPKLIALTGYAQDSDRKLALEAGFADHLAKPVEMSKLTSKLSGLLAAADPPN
jgi:PAS domain S-box-containing protein